MKTVKGFTLVELIIVVFIISLLMLIAVPTYFATKNKAYNNAAEQALTNSARSAAAYYSASQVLPSAAQMKIEQPAYDYVLGDEALAPPTSPPTIYVSTNKNYHIILAGGDVNDILKIEVANGIVGKISLGNP